MGLTTKVKRFGDRARKSWEQSRTHTSTRASWARNVLASPISQTILWARWGTVGLGTAAAPLPRPPRPSPPTQAALLLCADVLALHRATRHLAHVHSLPHILEPQAQVLAGDGESRPSLPRASLRGQLQEGRGWGGHGKVYRGR